MESSTSVIEDQLLISLRAWPAKDVKQQSLPLLISRVNQQRGSFRNITEQSLEEEIQAIKAGEIQSGQEDVDSSSDETVDAKSRTEDVKAARVEILQLVAQAQMESAYALDFVSLLLSRHAFKQAETTISPFLKQNVPMGSLGTEILQLPQVSDSKNRDDDRVSTGWKQQSLHATQDSLIQAATRLEKDLERETDYWEQVLAVKEKGWSICRLPREKHTLGVRYGFLEAAPEFRDRGLAALRKTENGHIDLDLGIRASVSRTLRVQVYQGTRVIASSVNRKEKQGGDDSIENSILQARNDIFDDELYHELHREARSLTNRGVRCTGDKILLPIGTDQQVMLDLVPTDSNTIEVKENCRAENGIAEIILTASRILLSHAHQQTANRRCQPPPPLVERKPPRPLYSILRPILAHLQHRSISNGVQEFLEGLSRVLARAGLNLTIDNSKSGMGLSKILNSTANARQPYVEALVSSMSAPLHSSMLLNLPTTTSQLALFIRTNTMGTEYKISVNTALPDTPLSSLPAESYFTTTADMEDHIMHLLTLDLMSLIETSPQGGGWSATSPLTGQLSIDIGVDGYSRLLALSLGRDRLELSWSGGSDAARVNGTCVWGETEIEGGNSRGLLEMAKRISTGRVRS